MSDEIHKMFANKYFIINNDGQMLEVEGFMVDKCAHNLLTGHIALTLLRSGKKVRRVPWEAGQYVWFDNGIFYCEANYKDNWTNELLLNSVLFGLVLYDDWEVVN